MSVKFVLLYLCHSHAFFFFFSRKQGNNERVLLESLKSKYKNILLGFKELKQMKQEQAQEEKAQEEKELTPREKMLLARKKNLQRKRRQKLPAQLR